MNFGLERIHQLLNALDRPDERTKIIHVAGTNGKGSVCAYVSSVLLTCGYTVGRFNSPHLLEPRDSINVNGEAVSAATYLEAMSHINQLNQDIGASSFECLVGAAFYVFDQAKVDFVVLEVGLGGLLDATNAIRTPVITAITSIGMDHAAILGNTIEAIALAKAGIMKPNCPVMIAPQDSSSALNTLIGHAQETNAPYRVVHPAAYTENGQLQLVIDNTDYTYSIQLCGDYQRMNSATAIYALHQLHALDHIKLDTEKLKQGMKNTRWPGRLDWITSKALNKFKMEQLLVDGAHNLPAVIALRTYINTLSKSRIIWIIGTTEGKDIREMMHTLIQEKDIVFAVSFSQPEGMPWIKSTSPEDIINQVSTSNATACFDLEQALTKAGKLRQKDDLVVLCGSLYLVADVYRLLLV